MKKIPLALAAAAFLSACTTAARTTATPATPAAAASPSAAPGCAQATAAVAAARHDINAQDYAGATTWISDLRDTVPSRRLKIDAALAATSLALLSYDATSGNPVYQDLKDALAGLEKISADCGA